LVIVSGAFHNDFGNVRIQALSEDFGSAISAGGKQDGLTLPDPPAEMAPPVIESEPAGRFHARAIGTELAQVDIGPSAPFHD
jgi:hypothetical protein